jgi:hypothetical protein
MLYRAVDATTITTTITKSLAPASSAPASNPEEGGNRDLADEFRAVVDSLRGRGSTCGT